MWQFSNPSEGFCQEIDNGLFQFQIPQLPKLPRRLLSLATLPTFPLLSPLTLRRRTRPLSSLLHSVVSGGSENIFSIKAGSS